MTNWNHVSSKLGRIEPETREIAREIYDVAQDAGHEIWFMWGNGTSREHSTGLALDLMIRNEAGGDWIRDYIWNNRARLRLRHVIWWRHILSTVVEPGVRRKMVDRGNRTKNHYDHLHVWFFAGDYQAPKKATVAAATVSGLIPKIQAAVEVEPDGMWGPKTDNNVMWMRQASRAKRGWPVNLDRTFDVEMVQAVIDTKVDGVWGPLSQAALVTWLKGFQDILDVVSDGYWGLKTDSRLLSLRRRYFNRY